MAVNQTDGSHIWSLTTGDYVVASVAVSRDNVVYAASSDKFLYALHDNDGSVIWKFQTGAAIVASPSLFPEHTMPVGESEKFFFPRQQNVTFHILKKHHNLFPFTS